MSEETQTSSHPLAVHILGAVLVLPILYAAACGPLLITASKFDDYHANFFRVSHFYRPLFKAAEKTHQEQALRNYLSIWKIRYLQIRVAGKTGTAQASRRYTPFTPLPPVANE